jgi:hypothetical protein
MRLFLLARRMARRMARQETQALYTPRLWLDNGLGHILVAGACTRLNRRSAALGKSRVLNSRMPRASSNGVELFKLCYEKRKTAAIREAV